MKPLITVLIFVFMMQPPCFTQQYGWINLGDNIPDSNTTQKFLRDVYFIGQEGWIAGQFNEAKVYYTPDGGQTFTSQAFPANSGQACHSVFMRTPLEGYAVTNAGYMLKTTDGGNNWVTIGTGMGLLHSLSFPPLPEPSGYACSDNGSVYKVTGSTIVQDHQVTGPLYSICFPLNSDEGWVAGGWIIKHRNATGWIIGDQNYSTGYWYKAIYFVDNQHGWAVDEPVIIRTINGTDWVTQNNPDNHQLNDVFFLNTQEGWAVGSNVILHTTDGGITWIEQDESLTDSTIFNSVFAVNSHEVYVTGEKYFGNNHNEVVLLKYTLLSSIERAPAAELEVYPNPSTSRLTIKNPGSTIKESNIEIVDCSGKMVKTLVTERTGPEILQVDISHLPPGVYFIKITGNKYTVAKKLIKLSE